MGEGPEAVRLRAFVLFARFARERDFICGPAGRSAFSSCFVEGGSYHPCGAAPILFFPEAPGSRARTAAYFCRAAKVGKNALRPTV